MKDILCLKEESGGELERNKDNEEWRMKRLVRNGAEQRRRRFERDSITQKKEKKKEWGWGTKQKYHIYTRQMVLF